MGGVRKKSVLGLAQDAVCHRHLLTVEALKEGGELKGMKMEQEVKEEERTVAKGEGREGCVSAEPLRDVDPVIDLCLRLHRRGDKLCAAANHLVTLTCQSYHLSMKRQTAEGEAEGSDCKLNELWKRRKRKQGILGTEALGVIIYWSTCLLYIHSH